MFFYIGFPADCKTHLDPSILVNFFFYNYVEAFDVIKRAIDIMAENEIAFVAEKLNDSIKRLEGGDEDLRNRS